MQSVSFSSSSSRNWSGISRGSSSSSVVAQESRDDIECYLSMFKGKEGEAGHAVDWGKLLDGHEVLESTEGLQDRVCEEEEQEGAEEGYYEEAVSVFLKPNTNHLPPKRPQEKHADARCSDGPNSRKTAHNHTESHTHNSSRRGLGLNVTTVSSHLNAGLEPGEEDVSTSTSASIERRSLHEKGQQFEGLVPRNTQNSDSRLLECTQSHKFDDSVGLGVRENGLAATTAQDSRLSIELSSTQGVSGEDESEPSLSGIFKNNIFSLDQLEPPVQPPVSRGSQLSPSNTSTNSATEGEEDNSWESRLPYKLRSLTELESPAVDRDALGGQEGADDNEETEMRVAAGTPRRPGTKESGRESCSSGENDGPCEADLMSDGGSEVLSYEDDFESSTLSKSDQELGTDISSASGVQEERGETTSDGEYGDHEHSTYERERERSSMTQQAAGGAEHTTASSDVSSTGGGEGIAARQEVCSEHDDKSGLHKSRVMHGRTSKQEGICISPWCLLWLHDPPDHCSS